MGTKKRRVVGPFKVGDVVRSVVNTNFEGTYVVVSVNVKNDRVDVRVNAPNGELYKNCPFETFEKVSP